MDNTQNNILTLDMYEDLKAEFNLQMQQNSD